MKLSLDLRTSLAQTLTPQQIQYLKLLQLPLVQLEQHVIHEIEQNPMLEEFDQEDAIFDSNEDIFTPRSEDNHNVDDDSGSDESDIKKLIDDKSDPFEFHRMLWEDSSPDYSSKLDSNISDDDDDTDSFQIKDVSSFTEDLQNQLTLIPLTREEYILGYQIIGNIDHDGYLRRDMAEIIDETNDVINDLNIEYFNRVKQESEKDYPINPAREFALGDESYSILSRVFEENPELDVETAVKTNGNGNGENLLQNVTEEQAEKVLKIIQTLDPPGVGSRTIQECLVSQLKALHKLNAAQKLALVILEEAYEPFTKKHYHVIQKQLSVTEDYLKEAIDVIRRLNPKPGGYDYQHEVNTVIPDFTVEKDEESNELIISVNDSRLPQLKLSSAYEKMKKEAKYKLFNKDTREWIRNKYEDAKFLIQALRQRKNTMLKVMTAIAHLQKDFFYEGPQSLKPLIYKNVAEETGLDISTVCRIVNGKYVQTGYGTFELKFFFSESLPSDEGEEVSTRVIKNILKEIIDKENKSKPLSDDKIAKELKDKGYNVARRTIAKYREQLKIPVARLRKEL